ncbi:MAG: hypothetical protein ABIC96_00095 [Patescibacteria group bacterium]
MDFLEIALIFLILLLSIFLGIAGIQVFFILRDLKKALGKLDAVLQAGENIAEDTEKPVETVGAKVVKALEKVIKRNPKSKRFYKKVL